MTALWKSIQDEIRLQLNAFRAFVGYGGTQSAGKIRLRRVTEATEGAELYALVSPFTPAVDEESVWMAVGGKPVCIGTLSRTAGPMLYRGSGSPEGVVTASIGSAYLRSDGGAGGLLYEKASGSGNTGWKVSGLERQHQKWVQKLEGGTSLSSVGQTAPAVTAAVTANGDASSGPWVRYDTSAVSGNVASIVADTDADARTSWATEWDFAIKMDPITSTRVWVGAFDGDPSGSSDPTLNGAGFRFDTGAGDTTWMCWTNDNSSGGTAVSSGATPQANNARILKIRCLSSSIIEFWTNGVLVHTATTNLPAGSAALRWRATVTTLTTAARSLYFGRCTMRHDQ